MVAIHFRHTISYNMVILVKSDICTSVPTYLLPSEHMDRFHLYTGVHYFMYLLICFDDFRTIFITYFEISHEFHPQILHYTSAPLWTVGIFTCR